MIFDHKVCDTIKLLNNKRHITAQKQKKLEELQTQYDQLVRDSEDAVNTDKGESADAQVECLCKTGHVPVCLDYYLYFLHYLLSQLIKTMRFLLKRQSVCFGLVHEGSLLLTMDNSISVKFPVKDHL